MTLDWMQSLVLDSFGSEALRADCEDYRDRGYYVKEFTDWLDGALGERYGE